MPRTKLLLTCMSIALFSCSLQAQQTNKAFLNRIVNARFIMVTTENGDTFDPATDRDDRHAAGDIENEIIKWKRFTIVYRPEDADIILAVRTGPTVRAKGGVHVGSHQDPVTGRRTNTIGSLAGADAGPANDLLSVYDAHGYPNSSILWRAEQKSGLSAPAFSLFNQFKKDVDKAATASKKP